MSGDSFVFRAGFTDGSQGIYRADLVGLEFADFADVAWLTLNGDVEQLSSILQLTPDEVSKAGSAFFSDAFHASMLASFQTQFTFQINGGEQGSDGMAFVIHSDPRGPEALGNDGGSLGFGVIGSQPQMAIAPSVAVEFDTFRNSGDPDDNHVGLIRNGEVMNHLSAVPAPFALNNGEPRYGWVDYDAEQRWARVDK